MARTPDSQEKIALFTKDFFKALVEELNKDDSLSKLTRGMNTTLLIASDDSESAFLVSLMDGRLSVREVSKDEPAEFKFSATYQEWVKIARGEAKIQGEVISGRVKFRGSMPKMLLYLNKVIGLEKRIIGTIRAMDLTY